MKEEPPLKKEEDESKFNTSLGSRNNEDNQANVLKGSGETHNFKQRLVEIAKAGVDGNMGSYGINKEATLKSIVSMRKTQVEIFRKHMGLELSLSENVDTEAEMNSKEFSEKFQEEFRAKENELKSITTMLDNLSTVMKSVNNDTKSEFLAAEPGLTKHAPKNVLKSLQRSRVQNVHAERQASWRNKLHLDASNSKSSEGTSGTK